MDARYNAKWHIVVGMLLLISMLASCSYNREFFVINKSNNDCIVILRLNIPVADYDSKNQLKGLFPYFNSTDIKMDDQTRYNLTNELDYETIDQFTMEVVLPSSSTMYLGSRSSNDPLFFESITIRTFREEIYISGEEILQKFDKPNFLALSPFYYIVKENKND